MSAPADTTPDCHTRILVEIRTQIRRMRAVIVGRRVIYFSIRDLNVFELMKTADAVKAKLAGFLKPNLPWLGSGYIQKPLIPR